MPAKYPIEPRPCQHCGKPFTPTRGQLRNGHGKFCSHSCYWSAPWPRVPIEVRFWRFVEKTDGCWIWQGTCQKFGHGQIGKGGRRKHGGGMVLAHRVSWEIHNGPIPDGLCVCHHCDNPQCVNPAHLFLGTKKDNTQDMVRKGRARGPDIRGEQIHTAKLTEDDVRTIRMRYACGGITQAELGEEFGVTRHAVKAIVSRRSWKHVD